MGATPSTRISRDISRAAAWPSETSRTMARGTTMLAEAPNAATKRHADITAMLGESAQPTVPTM